MNNTSLNPWAASDVTRTETDRLTWVWAQVLYPAIRTMLVGLPDPVRVPHLATANRAVLHSAAVRLDRVRRDHLAEQDLPADIIALAQAALYDAVGAARLLAEADDDVQADTAILAHSIREAQARTRAVTAYIGIEPEEAGVPDTLTEMEV